MAGANRACAGHFRLPQFADISLRRKICRDGPTGDICESLTA